MPIELFAGVLREGVQDREVVLGGEDRDVAHVGGQRRQPRLHIGASAVPAQQGMECEGEAQVVDSWQTAVGGANAGDPEQVPHQHA